MSFFKSIQDSIPTVDQLRDSFTKVEKQIGESIQPFAAKTQSLITEQVKQVQQLAAQASQSDIDVSELPKDYLQLEINCDQLLKLYTDLIQTTNQTYGQVSYDYPPGNTTYNKIKDAHVGEAIGAKFNQLKNVSSPQELERILLGQSDSSAEEAKTDSIKIQPTSEAIPRTLFGHLSAILAKQSEELQKQSDSNPLSLVLMQISSTYHEIAVARLVQDDKITKELNHKLVDILNTQFIKVNELRKKVYLTRSQFDQLRNKYEEKDPENEQLIAKEDELVGATELAVAEMKSILKPSRNIDLLKVLVSAQKEYFDAGSKRLASLLNSLGTVISEEDEE
ncbi:uncharacterized protein LODBEIA_P03310 [Lodderomyces beijingensis]|uniref:BAR domain-containing protein n=1 Tax=Lodderomyces beijingensis TaxID=1775926 RepID=A0ABP0ZIU8_9ASCO